MPKAFSARKISLGSKYTLQNFIFGLPVFRNFLDWLFFVVMTLFTHGYMYERLSDILDFYTILLFTMASARGLKCFICFLNQAANHPQAQVVWRVSRILEVQRVGRGDGAQAQQLLPRNLPSASPQTHSRYLPQRNSCWHKRNLGEKTFILPLYGFTYKISSPLPIFMEYSLLTWTPSVSW